MDGTKSSVNIPPAHFDENSPDIPTMGLRHNKSYINNANPHHQFKHQARSPSGTIENSRNPATDHKLKNYATLDATPPPQLYESTNEVGPLRRKQLPEIKRKIQFDHVAQNFENSLDAEESIYDLGGGGGAASKNLNKS